MESDPQSERPLDSGIKQKNRPISLNNIISLSLATILGIGYVGIKYETDRIRAQIAPIKEETEKLYWKEVDSTTKLNERLEMERKQAYSESAAMIARIERGAKTQLAAAEEETRKAARGTKELGGRLDALERGMEEDKEVTRRKEVEMAQSLQMLEKTLAELGGNARKRDEALRIVEETLRKRYDQEQTAAMEIVRKINPLLNADGLYIQPLLGVPVLNKIIGRFQLQGCPYAEIVQVEAEDGKYVDKILDNTHLEAILREIRHTKMSDGSIVYSKNLFDAIDGKYRSLNYGKDEEHLYRLFVFTHGNLLEYSARREMNEKQGVDNRTLNETFIVEMLVSEIAEMGCDDGAHREGAENDIGKIFKVIDKKRELGIGLYSKIPEGPLRKRADGLADISRDRLRELYQEANRKRIEEDK